MTTQGHLGLLDEHCSIFSDIFFFLSIEIMGET